MKGYKQILEIQKLQLEYALTIASQIEICDRAIEQSVEVEHFTKLKRAAFKKYADAIAAIVESAVDISLDFQNEPFQEKLLKEINAITEDYKRNHLGINITIT